MHVLMRTTPSLSRSFYLYTTSPSKVRFVVSPTFCASIPPPRMPLALRAPLRSTCLALRRSLRLVHLLERLLRDVANDFPAALDSLDGRHYFFPFFGFLRKFVAGEYLFCPLKSGDLYNVFLRKLNHSSLLAIRTSPLSRSIVEPASA